MRSATSTPRFRVISALAAVWLALLPPPRRLRSPAMAEDKTRLVTGLEGDRAARSDPTERCT